MCLLASAWNKMNQCYTHYKGEHRHRGASSGYQTNSRFTIRP